MSAMVLTFDRLTKKEQDALVLACRYFNILGICRVIYSILKRRRQFEIEMENMSTCRGKDKTPHEIMASINTLEDLRSIW